MKRLALYIVLSGMLGACASTPALKNNQNTATGNAAPAAEKKVGATTVAPKLASANSSTISSTTNTNIPKNLIPPYLDPSNALAQKRSVYFQFDQYTVDEQYRQLVEAHAKYLSQNHNTHIKIEGNADERGTAEYNLALGQKRADAVKKFMATQGVEANQVETISWGIEKPLAKGHDDAAWAKNRRADIVYPATSVK